MARLRYNGLATGASGSTVGLSLGASLTSSATSVTFNAALTHSNGTAVPTISGSDYIPLEILDANGRLSEIVYLTAYTAAATTGTISRGNEGTTGVAHSSGDKIVHGSTKRDMSPITFVRAQRTSGNITLNSTTFTNIDTGVDLVMAATAGDVIEVVLAVNVESSGNYVVFDFHTIVAGSPVNSVTSESAAGTSLSASFPAWGRGAVGGSPNGQYLYGGKRYVVQSGDLSSGAITLRLRGLSGASTTVKAVDPMLYVEATNLGPQV